MPKSKKRYVPRCCWTCEFCFPEQGGIKTESGFICAGYGVRPDNGEYTYGSPLDECLKLFPHGCGDYGISLHAYLYLHTGDPLL